MLSIHSFVKNYQAERVLAIESLSLAVGIHFIKGINGSGKTTLFKCLAGISPYEGTVSIEGVSLSKDPIAYRYRVNFAEAEPRYPGFLTARDLMLFVGKTKKATNEQINYYKECLGINWFYEKTCATYSSGMLKKLSLALAFLGAPQMIVLDEPLITLDEQTRKSLFRIMREKKGTLFLLSSHQTLAGSLPEINRTFRIENKNLIEEHFD